MKDEFNKKLFIFKTESLGQGGNYDASRGFDSPLSEKTKNKKKEIKPYRWIAYILPRKVLYWCVIRAWALATTEKYTKKTPYEVDWNMVCEHLGN